MSHSYILDAPHFETDPSTSLYKHHSVVFDQDMLKALDTVFQQGSILKYLSGIKNLFIAGGVITHLGVKASVVTKDTLPEIQRVELLSSVSDSDFCATFSNFAVFDPVPFWYSVTKVIERERTLADLSDSILGEDTFGLVFLVERVVKEVPTIFAVNLYRQSWKDKTEYYLTLFQTGEMWDSGHSFAIKLPE